jgi:hypothetical protein
MSKVLLDADLLAKLKNLAEPLELCDESGRVVARVTPVSDPIEFGPQEPQVSNAELRRREQSDERRYTTAEVLAHLRNL